jgi:calcium-dependent protein kinase
VKYTEFLAAAMQEQLYLAEDKILEAFHKLDLDHTGTITKQNLKELLGDDVDEAALERIIKDADYHNNGSIDLEEFKKMMQGGE